MSDNVKQGQAFVAESDKATALISSIIAVPAAAPAKSMQDITDGMNDLFKMLSDISFEDELMYYDTMHRLLTRLRFEYRNRFIRDKAVVAVCGKTNTGKSKFIKTLSGDKDILPIEQEDTPSLSIYIAKGSDSFTLMLSNGENKEITAEEYFALTQGFYDMYKTGFSSFIDNACITSEKFTLPDDVVLFDCRGFGLYTDKTMLSHTYRNKISALERVSSCDALIWLADISEGIDEHDISFLKDAQMEKKLLVVLNKADTKSEADIKTIIETCRDELDKAGIDYYAVTAYSAQDAKEYTDNKIEKFMAEAGGMKYEGGTQQRLAQVHDSIVEAIGNEKAKYDEMAKDTSSYILKSEKVMELGGAVETYKVMVTSNDYYNRIKTAYRKAADKLNSQINDLMK